VTTEREAAIQAARAMYAAEIAAIGQRRNDALKAWWAAENASREGAYAATKALNEAYADIDREYPQEGR